MSRVVFMCGPAGSGKSAVAKRLENEGLVRLSFDFEAWARDCDTMPIPEPVRAEIEADLRLRLIALVRDVLHGYGHAINYAPNAPEYFQQIADWLHTL